MLKDLPPNCKTLSLIPRTAQRGGRKEKNVSVSLKEERRNKESAPVSLLFSFGLTLTFVPQGFIFLWVFWCFFFFHFLCSRES